MTRSVVSLFFILVFNGHSYSQGVDELYYHTTDIWKFVKVGIVTTDPYELSDISCFDISKTDSNSKKTKTVLIKRLYKNKKGKVKKEDTIFIANIDTSGRLTNVKLTRLDIGEYYFSYNKNNLLDTIRHISRTVIEEFINWDEDIVINKYNAKNMLIEQCQQFTSCWPQGFKYKGTPYTNDTSFYKFFISYGENEKISEITSVINNFTHTAKYSYDSNDLLSNAIVTNRLNEVTKYTYQYINLDNGDSIYRETSFRKSEHKDSILITQERQYDKDKKLTREIDMVLQHGVHAYYQDEYLYIYDDKGILLKIIDSDDPNDVGYPLTVYYKKNSWTSCNEYFYEYY